MAMRRFVFLVVIALAVNALLLAVAYAVLLCPKPDFHGLYWTFRNLFGSPSLFYFPASFYDLLDGTALLIGDISFVWFQVPVILLILAVTGLSLWRCRARWQVGACVLPAAYVIATFSTNTCVLRVGYRNDDYNFRSIRLLEGYQIKEGWGIDSYCARIWKKDGADIHFDTLGHYVNPKREDYDYEWYRETSVDGVPTYWAIGRVMRGKRSLYVSFGKIGTFCSPIVSEATLVDAVVMLSTYQPRKMVRWSFQPAGQYDGD